MSMSDPIADFLTRIRNANMAHHDSVEVPASKMKKDIAEILKQEAYRQEPAPLHHLHWLQEY